MSNTDKKKIIGNLEQGLVFVISAPAGTGKTTLTDMLTDEFSCIVRSVSVTTRIPRDDETDGEDYFFVTNSEFENKKNNNEFLEYAQVFDNSYGTPKDKVQDLLKKGKHVLLVIDAKGAMIVKDKIQATFIFIEPPTIEDLKKRMDKRNSETDSSKDKRLLIAKEEMQMSKYYDYAIVNDDLYIAYDVLRSIIIAEEHKLKNNNK